MNKKYFKKVGSLIFATLMVAGVVFVSSNTAEAQGRRRVIIVRPNPYRVSRPFGFRRFGYPYGFGYDPWGYNRWGYDPWSPYGSYYRQYVFSDSESAVTQGYKHGFKTGKADGKKEKSYKPERSHYYHDAGFGNYAEIYRSGFSKGYEDGYRVGQNERGR